MCLFEIIDERIANQALEESEEDFSSAFLGCIVYFEKENKEILT